MNERTDQPRFKTLTEFVRYQTRDFTAAAGRFVGRRGLSPNAITLAGMLPTLIAALLMANGQFLIAGLLLLVGAPLDALDGAVARATNQVTRFGALLDSTTDRYADGFLCFGLAYYFAARGQMPEAALAIAALIGAYAVSYVRARAEGLNIGSIKDGLFDRMVRTLVLIAALITGWLVPGLVILVVGTHLTAIQRLLIAYGATKDDIREAGIN